MRLQNKSKEIEAFALEDWQRIQDSDTWRKFEVKQTTPSGRIKEVLVESLNTIAKDLLTSGLIAKAQELAGENLRLHTMLAPEKWQSWAAKSLLGECFLKAGQLGPAEEMLKEAVDQLMIQKAQIPK